ncbi:hypothetical protein evm_013073 [Chilo suppressalis]|nr:hypothetical protein evm_013073 [Chilo suppressalis]
MFDVYRKCMYIGCLLCCLTSSVLPDSTAPPTTAAPAARSDDAGAAPAAGANAADADSDDPPEGYYAFVESPNATPPRVRPPPYRKVDVECAEAGDSKPHVTAHNLCGDLNRGDIPRNPMGQSVDGEPYPFELIRNHTLRFLSRALPALRNDDSLPRVTRLPATPAPTRPDPGYIQHNGLEERSKRSASAETESQQLRAEHRGAQSARGARDGRKFCDGGGV